MAGQGLTTDRTSSRAAWRTLTTDLLGQRAALYRALAWMAAEATPALFSGALVAGAVDRGFLAGRPAVGLGLLGLLGLLLALQVLASRQVLPWLGEAVEPLRDAFATRVVTGTVLRAVAGIDHPDTSAVARLTGQVQAVRGLVSAMLRMLRRTVVSLVLGLTGLLALAPVVALMVTPLVALGLGGYLVTLRRLNVLQRAALLADEDVATTCGAVFHGIRDITAVGGKEQALATVETSVNAHAEIRLRLMRATSVRTAIVAVAGQGPIAVVLLTAPWLVSSGRLTVGQLVGATTYLLTVLEPAIRTLVSTVGTWGRQLGVTIHRLLEASALPEPPETGARAPEPERFDLRADRVTFAYAQHAEPIVQDFSLTLAHGDHLAVIGPSGIGKSTLAYLLAGLTGPQSGRILLGDTPLGTIDPGWLRRTVVLIPQEAYVFAGTVRENLTYLHAAATDADLDRTVSALRMTGLIRRLGGYDAQIGATGIELSGGERQLIALARVHLTPAPIVVLDEATCHLDPEAEARVEAAFAARTGTLVVIAHRLSSARRAERVLLLGNGTAVEGTHDDLLATSDLYADLTGRWSATAHPQPAQQGTTR